MTREEFENKAREVCASTGQSFRTPNVEEMKLIDYVYMYHPSISNVQGKGQIAYLYVIFGMRLIRDMESTARVMENYEIKQRKLREKLKKLDDDMEDFMNGGKINDEDAINQ